MIQIWRVMCYSFLFHCSNQFFSRFSSFFLFLMCRCPYNLPYSSELTSPFLMQNSHYPRQHLGSHSTKLLLCSVHTRWRCSFRARHSGAGGSFAYFLSVHQRRVRLIDSLIWTPWIREMNLFCRRWNTFASKMDSVCIIRKSFCIPLHYFIRRRKNLAGSENVLKNMKPGKNILSSTAE